MLDLKERSHKKVFSLIRAQGNVSGAMLAKQTEMQPSSLVYILRHLKDRKLIKMSGYGSSTFKGGKKPLLWQVNPDFGNILGLEVMRHAIRAVLVNLAGEIVLKVEKEFNPGKPEKTISRIQKTIAEVIYESGVKPEKLLYISIAVPGVVDPISHQVIHSYALKFFDFDLKSRIMTEFSIPTGIINDANAGALGEQWFSQTGSSASNILYIMYNPMAGGMGLGVILNQKLYLGSNGIAGEFFSSVPSLELIISNLIRKIPRENIMIPVSNINEIQISDLFAYMKRGCEFSFQVLEELSRQVSVEISKITGLFDPEKIILGGDLSICEDLCCNEIILALKELLSKYYPFIIKVPTIEYAHHKVFSAAIGATALYLSEELVV
jgi:predicted NBD/HSP70 family sugar kinase